MNNTFNLDNYKEQAVQGLETSKTSTEGGKRGKTPQELRANQNWEQNFRRKVYPSLVHHNREALKILLAAGERAEILPNAHTGVEEYTGRMVPFTLEDYGIIMGNILLKFGVFKEYGHLEFFPADMQDIVTIEETYVAGGKNPWYMPGCPTPEERGVVRGSFAHIGNANRNISMTGAFAILDVNSLGLDDDVVDEDNIDD